MPDHLPAAQIEEMSNLPTSIASVQTAVPAFIGYTQKTGGARTGEYLFAPKQISSLQAYERYFGFSNPETSLVATVDTKTGTAKAAVANPSPYLLYYALQLYFANGGGACYVVSTGDYTTGKINASDLQKGLDAIAGVDDVTLLLSPDAFNLASAGAYYTFYKAAMHQCVVLRNRFAVLDVWTGAGIAVDPVTTLRSFDFGAAENLRYAAAYYPRIFTNTAYAYHENLVVVKAAGDTSLSGTLAQLAVKNKACYAKAKDAIGKLQMLLPSSPAVAGIYAQTDNTRGVWKAPANVNINAATFPETAISDAEQEALNVDAATGKSINAIRSFPGRGAAIVWGSRTLAGNDTEGRYVSVRRFFIMVEASVRNGIEAFVFEPNDQNTWTKVKSLIENYLAQQWRAGALMGRKTNEAFYVRVGFGQTMTNLDVLQGRLILEIGMAILRPAEFIVLRIVLKMTGT